MVGQWSGRAVGSRAAFRLDGPVAQLVEHRTFNAVVAGSSPARLTKIPGDLPGDVVELDSLGAEESANIHLNPELLRLFVQDSN